MKNKKKAAKKDIQPDKESIKRLEKYSESINRKIDYSVERFDILIISLSSGGLVLSIGFIKDVLKDVNGLDTCLLKESWILFASSIIMNLLSQITAFYANRLDLRITNDIIYVKRGEKSSINQLLEECKMRIINKCTLFLNGLSLLSLLLAIIILIFFISINV